jgi:hypothetical protein
MLAPRLLAADWRSLMSNIEPYRRRLPDRRSRALSQIDRDLTMARQLDRANAARAAGRISDLQTLTQHTLLAATEVAMAEAFCVERAPHAAGRLAHLADIGTAGMAGRLLEEAQRW